MYVDDLCFAVETPDDLQGLMYRLDWLRFDLKINFSKTKCMAMETMNHTTTRSIPTNK